MTPELLHTLDLIQKINRAKSFLDEDDMTTGRMPSWCTTRSAAFLWTPILNREQKQFWNFDVLNSRFQRYRFGSCRWANLFRWHAAQHDVMVASFSDGYAVRQEQFRCNNASISKYVSSSTVVLVPLVAHIQQRKKIQYVDYLVAGSSVTDPGLATIPQDSKNLHTHKKDLFDKQTKRCLLWRLSIVQKSNLLPWGVRGL